MYAAVACPSTRLLASIPGWRGGSEVNESVPCPETSRFKGTTSKPAVTTGNEFDGADFDDSYSIESRA